MTPSIIIHDVKLHLSMVMDAINWFVTFLSYFGLTPEEIFPQLVVLGVGLFIFHWFSVRPVGKDAGKIQKCVEGINHASREMQDKLKTLIEKSTDMDNWNPLHTLEEKLDWSKMNSPMFLNDDGNALLVESPIKKFVEDRKSELLKFIEDKNPTTAYDVQRHAMEAVSKFIKEDMETTNKIKDFVYHHPIFKGKEVEIPAILFVGSLHLREEYLNKHEELKKTNYDGEGGK